MRFIEQFYYGNIEPQERSTKPSKAIKKQMEILVKGEGLFTELLDDELKNAFLNMSTHGTRSTVSQISTASSWTLGLVQILRMTHLSATMHRSQATQRRE